MGKHKRRKWLWFLVIAVGIGWPTLKLMDTVEHRREPIEVTRLLYQVALFQYELMNSHVRSAGQLSHSSQLELLKQSAYSMQYTHQRLCVAMEGEIDELVGLDEMLEYIMRLQIGGYRQLSAQQVRVFELAAPFMQAAYESYQGLLSSGGEVAASNHVKLLEADADLFELFHNELLE